MNSEYIYVYFQLLKDTFSNIYKTAVVKESERAAGEWITTHSLPLSHQKVRAFTSSTLCAKCVSSCTGYISSIQFFASCFCGSFA